MTWAVGWLDDRTVVMASGDLGTLAWRMVGVEWRRVPDRNDPAICERAKELHRAQYTRREDDEYSCR